MISDKTLKTTQGKDSLVCIKDGLYERPLLSAGPVGEVSEDRTYVHVRQGVRDITVLGKDEKQKTDKSYEIAEEEGCYDCDNSVRKVLFYTTYNFFTYLPIPYVHIAAGKRSRYSDWATGEHCLIRGSNLGSCTRFIFPPRHPDRVWFPFRLLFPVYRASFQG